jgi:hypothetical protein
MIKLLLPLICLMGCSSLWAQGKTGDESDEYVVSPSGKYIVKITPNKDSFESSVYVAETANPSKLFSLAGIAGGKGASASFSPDEQWLLVNDYVVVHSCEPRLYRHIAGARFEPLASMDVTQQISDYLKGGDLDPEMVSLEDWASDSSGFTLSAKGEHVHGRWPYCQVLYSLAQGRPIRKTNTRFLLDGADDPKDAQRFEESQRQLQEQQLNLIYRVLKRTLNPQAQQQLVVEERKWIEDREKAKNDPNSGWDAITRDRIAQLAERVLR